MPILRYGKRFGRDFGETSPVRDEEDPALRGDLVEETIFTPTTPTHPASRP